MSTDIEGNVQRRPGAAPSNPYTGPGPDLPENAYIFKMKRIFFMCVSVYGLQHLNFYRAIMGSPHVSHEWFKIGLAGTIAILSIKAYVELFEGRIKKTEVNYKNFRQTTHAVLFLLLMSSLAFNVALWPHYGWNSPIVLGLAFFGVILQFLLLVPTSIQNAVAFVGITYFLQEYS
jgi:hypothetical protein